ncbi:Metallophos_C domain-containing protein, partial [Cephalotus follicularis]
KHTERLLYSASVDMVLAGHLHAYERSKCVYNGYSDPCGLVHITIRDAGNREGLASKNVLWKVLYVIKLFTIFYEASFGHGELKLVNSTHALWSWHKNDDDEPVKSDQVWITSLVNS